MTIEELRHIIRACRNATNHTEFLIVGSQVVLGYKSDDEISIELKRSREADIVPIPPLQELSDIIDGVLGEESQFDKEFHIYAHGNDLNTAVFPDEWETRVNTCIIEGCKIHFPSLEDFAISKYIAGREKDLLFVKELWIAKLLDRDLLESLLDDLPNDKISLEKCDVVISRIKADIEKYATGEVPKLG